MTNDPVSSQCFALPEEDEKNNYYKRHTEYRLDPSFFPHHVRTAPRRTPEVECMHKEGERARRALRLLLVLLLLLGSGRGRGMAMSSNEGQEHLVWRASIPLQMMIVIVVVWHGHRLVG